MSLTEQASANEGKCLQNVQSVTRLSKITTLLVGIWQRNANAMRDNIRVENVVSVLVSGTLKKYRRLFVAAVVSLHANKSTAQHSIA